MSEDIFEEKLKEMRDQIKEWWGKLTDDDLEQAAGTMPNKSSACSNTSMATPARAPKRNLTSG